MLDKILIGLFLLNAFGGFATNNWTAGLGWSAATLMLLRYMIKEANDGT